MGLSIYYRLKAKVDANAARALVRRLRAKVLKLPFDEVSEISEYDPPDGRYVFAEGTWGPFKPGTEYLTRKRGDGLTESVIVPAQHVVCFSANLEGSETAMFGLATHPAVVVHREDVVNYPDDVGEERVIGAGPAVEFPTRLRGWYSWWHSCKTQYASNPKQGGEKNFLRAHLSVFKAVDEAKKLGIKTYIRDDAKYWRHRDEKKLLAELKKWDELIAGFAGRLSDRLEKATGEKGLVVAPIKDRPDFEHLEARGAERLGGIGRRKKRR